MAKSLIHDTPFPLFEVKLQIMLSSLLEIDTVETGKRCNK